MYEKVEGYYLPREELLQSGIEFIPEMTEYESAFLCGLLKKYKPRKIVEVGVARGGTTSIIVKCMQCLEIDNYEMHSIDLSESVYKDADKKTGYNFLEACSVGICQNKNHCFHLGKYLPDVIDQIGNNIDFMILDTVHSVPGELLDMIVALTYLSSNAIVVLHDLAYIHNFYYAHDSKVNVTMHIINVLKGKKYLNTDRNNADSKRKIGYPNIGAVMVNREDAGDNAWNLLSSLTMLWDYMPDNVQLDKYKKMYAQIYGQKIKGYFEWIIELQKLTLSGKQNYRKTVVCEFKEVLKNNTIVIYGTGIRGRRLKAYCDLYNSDVFGFCVSDDFSTLLEIVEGLKVYRLHELSRIEEHILIVVASSSPEVFEELKKYDYNYFVPDICVFDAINLLF